MTTFSLRRCALALPVALALVASACGDDDSASVSFDQPADGASIAGGVALAMSADGITIEEAGEVHDDAGHFHVIADDGCVDPGAAVARDADHVHFGGGQSEGKIYLEPGTHELCLQVGDGEHVALRATDRVTVEVGITDQDEWCAVVTEIDDLFAESAINDDDFALAQGAAVNVSRLFAQLAAAMEQVDDDARADVAEEIEFGQDFVAAFVEADDFEGVEAALQEIYGPEGHQSDGAGSTWILENCGVDIDD